MEDESIVDSAIDVQELHAQAAVQNAEMAQEEFIDRQSADHIDELVTIAETVQNSEASPQTLAIAMERMDVLAGMYGIPTLGMAREGFVDSMVQKGAQAKDEVVQRAYAVAQGVFQTVIQRMKNTAARLSVNLRTMFKRARTYSADANNIKQRAQALRNSQLTDPEAAFKRQIHVAHFTRGDRSIATTGSELLTNLAANHAAFQEVGNFMEKFQHVFSFRGANKGHADFDEMAKGFTQSRFFPHAYTLSGGDALFGEEFLMTEIAGEANSIEEMISVVRGIHISHEYIWRVKELDLAALPPLSPREISSDIDKMIEAGAYIYEFSRTWDQTIGKYVRNAQERATRPPWENMDFYKSPGNYLLYNRLYCNIILQLGAAIGDAIATNEKALLCMLDYYKWSLDQYK